MRVFSYFICIIACLFTFTVTHAADTTPATPAASSSSDDDGIGDNSAKDDQQIYFMYGDVDLQTTLKYQYPKARMMIKTVYPQLISETPDDTIDNFNNLVVQVLQTETDDFKAKVAAAKSSQDKLPKAVTKNELYIDYDSSFINTKEEHILSIRFTIAGIIGGSAHGYLYHRVLNYDLDSGETLDLADLFLPETNYLEQLSAYTRSALTKRLTNKSMIAAGTEPTADNFKNWNLKPLGVLITFEEYQVAPYVFGAQTVLVPYAALADIIDPDAPIYECLKNRSHCLHSNLLTGGFIDEA